MRANFTGNNPFSAKGVKVDSPRAKKMIPQERGCLKELVVSEMKQILRSELFGIVIEL